MMINNQYLEGLVLSVLNEGQSGAYPYKIAAELGKTLHISDATIYSVCNRLLKKEWICLDEKIHIVNGRIRKYYLLSQLGCEKLRLMKAVYDNEKVLLDKWFGGSNRIGKCI